MSTDSAQLFHGIHDTPVYTDLFFRKPLRLWVAAPAAVGLTATFVATMQALDAGHSRAVLFTGLILTGIVCGIGAIIPHGRPGLSFRAKALWRTVRPVARSPSRGPARGLRGGRVRPARRERPPRASGPPRATPTC